MLATVPLTNCVRAGSHREAYITDIASHTEQPIDVSVGCACGGSSFAAHMSIDELFARLYAAVCFTCCCFPLLTCRPSNTGGRVGNSSAPPG